MDSQYNIKSLEIQIICTAQKVFRPILTWPKKKGSFNMILFNEGYINSEQGKLSVELTKSKLYFTEYQGILYEVNLLRQYYKKQVFWESPILKRAQEYEFKIRYKCRTYDLWDVPILSTLSLDG